MGEPGGKQRKNSNGTLTMRRLLDFALAEFERSGPIDFNLDNVLRESGVSRGSFYHHFGSRARIIARCETEHLERTLKADAQSTRQLVESGISGAQIFDLLMAGVRDNATPAARARRQQRIQTLAIANNDPELLDVINLSHVKGVEFLTGLIQAATERGLLSPVVDAEGLSNLIPAMLVGLIYVDNLGDQALAEKVCETIVDTLRHLLRPN